MAAVADLASIDKKRFWKQPPLEETRANRNCNNKTFTRWEKGARRFHSFLSLPSSFCNSKCQSTSSSSLHLNVHRPAASLLLYVLSSASKRARSWKLTMFWHAWIACWRVYAA